MTRRHSEKSGNGKGGEEANKVGAPSTPSSLRRKAKGRSVERGSPRPKAVKRNNSRLLVRGSGKKACVSGTARNDAGDNGAGSVDVPTKAMIRKEVAPVDGQDIPLQDGSTRDKGTPAGQSYPERQRETLGTEEVEKSDVEEEALKEVEGVSSGVGGGSASLGVSKDSTGAIGDVLSTVLIQKVSKTVAEAMVGMTNNIRRSFNGITIEMEEEKLKREKESGEVTKRLEDIDSRLTRIEDGLNIILFATASKAKSGNERERLMMNEVLQPLEYIFTGEFFTQVFVRATTIWAMGIITEEVSVSTEEEADGDNYRLSIIRAGMLILESLLWSRPPGERKSVALVGSPQARNHFILRRKLTKTLVALAGSKPELSCVGLRDIVHPSIRGSVENVRAPFWLKKGFITKEVQNEVIGEMEEPTLGDGRRTKRGGKKQRGSGERAMPEDEEIAREVVRKVYKMETQWLNKSRDNARKSFFECFAYMFHADVNAMVKGSTAEEEVLKLPSIPLSKVTAKSAPECPEMMQNNEAWEDLCDKCVGMFYVADFKVTVEEGSGPVRKTLSTHVSMLDIGKRFLASFCRIEDVDVLFTYHSDMLKIIYVVSIVFQLMLVHCTEGLDSVPYMGEVEKEKLKSLYTSLKYENDGVVGRILKEKTFLTEERFNRRHVTGEDDGDLSARGDSGEEDVDEDVVDMEGLM